MTLLFRIGTSDVTFYVTAESEEEARGKAAEILNGDAFTVAVAGIAPW